MSIKTMILGAVAVASVAIPGAASAQSYGQYGSGYGQGYQVQRYYGAPAQYGYDARGYDNRDNHFDRRRFEERRRWQEMQRRRQWEWAHHRGHHQDRDDYDRY